MSAKNRTKKEVGIVVLLLTVKNNDDRFMFALFDMVVGDVILISFSVTAISTHT